MVPHSHDDLGSIKTTDEAFFGFNQKLERASVSRILDSVVAEMARRPQAKFTYVEMKYFEMWYSR